MKPILIIACIAFAWWCVSSFGLVGWGGISLAMLCVVLLIALNENQPKQKKDDGEHDESPKFKPKKFNPKKKHDDDNDFFI